MAEEGKKKRKKAIKLPAFLAVDFFCGAGGTTRGLIDAGGYVIAGVDKDTACEKTYTENNPNDFLDYSTPRFLEYDIFPATDTYPEGQQSELFDELEELINFYRAKVPGVPLFFAICAPCQPFTTVSKKALTEKRSEGRKRDQNLLTEAAKFVERFKPELVLSENVRGIGDPKYGGIWDDFQERLRDLEYAIGSKVVCASKFGIPQYRKRSILLAVHSDRILKDRFIDAQENELTVPSSDPDSPMVTVKEAIDHLPTIGAGMTDPKVPNHKTRTLNELNLKRISCAKPGETNKYLLDTAFGDLSLSCHKKVNARLEQRCFNDVYTRMSPDKPSPTITTKCYSISNGRFGHYDTTQDRGISLREAALLQSFPDDYIFYPKDVIGPVGRMIGNAVPPKLAEFYARYLTGTLDG